MRGRRGGRQRGPRSGEQREVSMDKATDLSALNAQKTEENGPSEAAYLPMEEMGFEDLIQEGKFEKGSEIIQGIYSQGHSQPSKIQCQTIPLLTQTPPKSVLAQAPTGTGKTIAFLVPVFLRVKPDLNELQAICMAPTRELVLQTHDIFQKLTELCPLKTGIAINNYAEPPEDVQVLFGTPVSVKKLAHNDAETKPNFTNVKIVIFDEADEIVKRDSSHHAAARFIIKHIPQTAQLGFFSATYSKDDKYFIERQGRDVQPITIPRTEQLIEKDNYFIRCKQDQVDSLLQKIINTISMESAYVYVARKSDTKHYVELFEKNGISAAALTSDINVDQRDATFKDFREGKIRVLVTVNAFARGLDNPDATHVFNIDLPIPIISKRKAKNGKEIRRIFDDVDSYVHRAGRAGRFGRKGIVISFIKRERDLRTLKAVSLFTKITIHELDPATIMQLSNTINPETSQETLAPEVVEKEADEIEKEQKEIEKDQQPTETEEVQPISE